MALELVPQLLNGSKARGLVPGRGKGGIVQIIPTLPFLECSLLCWHAAAEIFIFHEMSRAVDNPEALLTTGLGVHTAIRASG